MSTIVTNLGGHGPRASRTRHALGFYGRFARKLPKWRRVFIAAGILAVGAGSYLLFVGVPEKHLNSATQGLSAFASKLGFEIEDVRLIGNQMVSEQMVLFALGTGPNEAIFGFDVSAAKERVESLAWVESVSIQRLWPNTLQVSIVEREPYALWQTGGKVFVIDAKGHVLEEFTNSAFASLPRFVGEGAEKHAKDLMTMMADHPDIAQKVVAYVRVADRRWNLRLASGADVKLPEENTKEALELLSVLDAREGLLSRNVEMVDLRLQDRVTVRLPEEAVAAEQQREANGGAR